MNDEALAITQLVNVLEKNEEDFDYLDNYYTLCSNFLTTLSQKVHDSPDDEFIKIILNCLVQLLKKKLKNISKIESISENTKNLYNLYIESNLLICYVSFDICNVIYRQKIVSNFTSQLLSLYLSTIQFSVKMFEKLPSLVIYFRDSNSYQNIIRILQVPINFNEIDIVGYSAIIKTLNPIYVMINNREETERMTQIVSQSYLTLLRRIYDGFDPDGNIKPNTIASIQILFNFIINYSNHKNNQSLNEVIMNVVKLIRLFASYDKNEAITLYKLLTYDVIDRFVHQFENKNNYTDLEFILILSSVNYLQKCSFLQIMSCFKSIPLSSILLNKYIFKIENNHAIVPIYDLFVYILSKLVSEFDWTQISCDYLKMILNGSSLQFLVLIDSFFIPSNFKSTKMNDLIIFLLNLTKKLSPSSVSYFRIGLFIHRILLTTKTNEQLQNVSPNEALSLFYHLKYSRNLNKYPIYNKYKRANSVLQISDLPLIINICLYDSVFATSLDLYKINDALIRASGQYLRGDTLNALFYIFGYIKEPFISAAFSRILKMAKLQSPSLFGPYLKLLCYGVINTTSISQEINQEMIKLVKNIPCLWLCYESIITSLHSIAQQPQLDECLNNILSEAPICKHLLISELTTTPIGDPDWNHLSYNHCIQNILACLSTLSFNPGTFHLLQNNMNPDTNIESLINRFKVLSERLLSYFHTNKGISPEYGHTIRSIISKFDSI